MTRVVAFNLAKIGEEDARFFRGLSDAFVDYGGRMELFSANTHDLIRPFRLDFSWTIKNIEAMHALPTAAEMRYCLTSQRRAVWVERVSCLALQNYDGPPEKLVEILERFANFVLAKLRPDLILSWNTLCPHSGVLADIAQDIGIPVLMIERAFLPNTWFLEKGGLVGHSVLTGTDFETLIGTDRVTLADLGRSYLAADPFRNMSRYSQRNSPRFAERLANRRQTGRPIIGFFPPDDLSLGFRPADGLDRVRHLPYHASSLDAALALARAAPECDVIFKPHPSFLELELPDQVISNLFIIDHDYREVIAAADVVASTGSGLVVQAMAMGKPVLSMGRDQFTAKGITYDAQQNIRPALDDALRRDDLALRLDRFQTFIGYCLRHYLVSSPDADHAFRRPGEAVAAIMSDMLPTLPVRRPRKAPSDSAPPGTLRDRSKLFHRLDIAARNCDDGGGGLILVDFDHTLMLANSTELFLDRVRPRFFFAAVHWLLSWLAPWKRWGARGIARETMFDPLRLALILLVAPWTIVWWWVVAPELGRRLANKVLLARLQAIDLARVVVVSNGHPWVIRPLLWGMGLGRARQICDSVLPGIHSIRREGKLAACHRRLRGFDPDRSIVITDSLDDHDLLAAVRTAFLIDWGELRNKADPLAAYVPFVLTTEGKYPGARVVRRHRLQEDLPVILCAFALAGLPQFGTDIASIGPAALSMLGVTAALFLFFLSFNAVYEIGYWDNDFIAATAEAQPNVSPKMERFRHYPIHRQAWIWGLVLGAMGSALAAIQAAPFLLLPNSLAAAAGWTGEMPVEVSLFFLTFTLWTTVLMGMRALFRAHNAAIELRRIYTFWLLHFIKLAAFGAIFATNPAGLILLVAQVFRHWTHYVVYRFKGDKTLAPRYDIRAFFFLFLTAALLMILPASDIFTPNWVLGAALVLFRPEYWRFWPSRTVHRVNNH